MIDEKGRVTCALPSCGKDITELLVKTGNSIPRGAPAWDHYPEGVKTTVYFCSYDHGWDWHDEGLPEMPKNRRR